MVNKRSNPSQAVTHINVELTPSRAAVVLLAYFCSQLFVAVIVQFTVFYLLLYFAITFIHYQF